MKKVIVIAFLSISFLAGLSFLGRKINSDKNENNGNKVSGAEKIEVIHFHGTNQCWSCITVGKYALKTIKEKFPEEYKNGTIVFKEVNGELPANKTMVEKYQATGSSLYVNSIKGGKDNISEDVNVWRLVSNEKQFIDYFEDKLDNLLK